MVPISIPGQLEILLLGNKIDFCLTCYVYHESNGMTSKSPTDPAPVRRPVTLLFLLIQVNVS